MTTVTHLPVAAEAGVNPTTFLLPALMLVFMLFLVFRGRKAQQQAAERRSRMSAGDRVMSSSGLFGTVVSKDETAQTALVEIAPGTRVTMHLGALNPAPQTSDAGVSAAESRRAGNENLLDAGQTAEPGRSAHGDRLDRDGRGVQEDTFGTASSEGREDGLEGRR